MFGFESFFGGPGGPGGDDDDGPGGPPGGGPVDNKTFYKLLEVDTNASEAEIKKAYRKAALSKHPDKGGSHEEFQAIQKAYEVLSDPEKRRIYDKYGEKGLSGDAEGPGGGMDDILRSFFGGGGGPRGPSGPPRGKDVGVRFPVSLEELYNGADKVLDWKRKMVCSVCSGVGGPPEAKVTCDTCDGKGIVVQVIRMGPMIQQQRMHCPACKGEGFSIKESLKCKPCKGNGIVIEDKKINFEISPGLDKGDKIKLAEEGDKVIPEMIPGDVYVILEPEEHKLFERKGDHLIYTQRITLLEALTDFKIAITHLDGRTLNISSEPKHVYKPGELKLIRDEGMPTHRNPLLKGHLFVKFEVEFPDSLTLKAEDVLTLQRLLPKPDRPLVKPEEEKKSAGAAPAKKGKKKGKKGAATAAPSSTGSEEEPPAPEVLDAHMEDIPEDILRKLKETGAKQAGSDEEGGDGPQCRVQ